MSHKNRPLAGLFFYAVGKFLGTIMPQPFLFRVIDKAVYDYGMIQEGDRILVRGELLSFGFAGCVLEK